MRETLIRTTAVEMKSGSLVSVGRCLREIIGYCNSCNIAEIALDKIRRFPQEVHQAEISRISTENCPIGIDMVLDRRVKRSIW